MNYYKIINEIKLFVKNITILMIVDNFYVNSENNYGLLTNYYLYFFNYRGGDIDRFFINLKKKSFFKAREFKRRYY